MGIETILIVFGLIIAVALAFGRSRGRRVRPNHPQPKAKS
jgi:hypothetical protein